MDEIEDYKCCECGAEQNKVSAFPPGWFCLEDIDWTRFTCSVRCLRALVHKLPDPEAP